MEEKHGTVHLEEIGQIALTVADLEEAKTFYRDVLGMKIMFEAGTMAFFQCGSVRLLIGAAEPGAEKPAAGMNGTILYFRVQNIESVNGQLKEKGVKFVQEPHLVARMKSHDLWLASFEDPSGNVLELMSEKTRNPGEEKSA
jgi:methylmalonyl-CoA/ethylmalonyl-CoA epimerase